MAIDTRTWIRVWKEVHKPYFDENGRLPKDWRIYPNWKKLKQLA